MDATTRTPEITIIHLDGAIRVLYRGVVEYGPTNDMLRKVVALSKQTGSKRLLFDIREADYSHYLVNSIRHAEEGDQLGIDSSFRIAFLGGAGIPMLQIIETVTTTRGYTVKAFTDPFEAEVWLVGRR